ncbi:TonB-dependent receptor [Bacteroides sp. 51]|uniref:SusC/RagA family TonB-linked outer membrane protein n=1 Tax=Bacteroides sp. 51 TaxID=2302938 RepID=UPI0013D5F916|nr:TonB-dependent receptor [Bacteroides sp. 51]
MIKGQITDQFGETMIGVNVMVKDAFTGTITDMDGNYRLSAPSNATLVFSSVGMETQEIKVAGRTTINVVMAEAAQSIEEVVVTAFATQKKINVTGAISAVSGKDILASPVSNISNALVGVTPGLSAVQAGGEPGRNEADITIRGVATYGSTAPLIVIDGIEQAAEQAFTAFNSIDPNEILGISVLKDASSTAVYGIRAANGVIIVTTKRGGLGKPRVSLSSNFGFTKATALQKGLSSYDWASFRNEGVQNEMDAFGNQALSSYLYSEDDLWKFKNNRDFTPAEVDAMTHLTAAQREQLKNSPALYYGSNDLYAQQFGEYGPQWQVNVNLSGGTEKVKYFASLGYLNQGSITDAAKYYGSDTGSQFTRYNFRANVDIDVIKNTTISVNMAGQFGTTQGPGIDAEDPYNLSSRYKIIMQYIYDGNPFMAPGIIDNHLISGLNRPAGSVQESLFQKTGSTVGDQNAVYNLLKSGTGYLYNTLLDNTIRIKHSMTYLVKGLSIQASLNYQDNYNRYVTKRPSIPEYTVRRGMDDPNVLEFFGGGIGGDTFTSKGYSNWNKLYIDAGLTYDGTFGDHNIGLLFLGKASRYTMPDDVNNTPSGIMGLVGRFTYDYKQRYMAEFNMGYNGTEQFAEGKRFGFFPAFSLGWVPSNESFFPENDWVTFLKFRGSYGEVGNDQLGQSRYLYLPNTYRLNQGGYYFGTSDGSSPNAYYPGAAEGNLGNPNVTWEKAKKYDIGFEARFFKDKLSLTFDYFNEDRENILTRLGVIPASYGVAAGSVPPANVGETNNKGYEVVLGWNDQIGKVGYQIEGNMSYTKNKILYKAEAPNPYDWMNETGHSIGQRFGLKSDGLYNTLEELNSRPYNTFTSNKTTLGDIKYIDLNGDGVIDNKDIAPIGYPNRAQYQFGVKLGFTYKGFDLRMLFNGTANGSFYLRRISIPFYKNAGNAFKWQYDGRWTPEKYAAGEKITYPRATFNSDINSHNFLNSDYWMMPNDFFKLKNIELGYTFPSSMRFMQAAKISSLRLYANANNVYTFINKMRHIGIDPETRETSDYSYVYPITTTVVFGFTIQY